MSSATDGCLACQSWHVCLGLPTLIYMDECIKEMKVSVWDLGATLNVRGVKQPPVARLYVDDTKLLAESEGMLHRIVDEFDRVCKRRQVKVNAGRSKVMVFERAKEHTTNFAKPYRVGQRLYLDVRYGWGRRKWSG